MQTRAPGCGTEARRPLGRRRPSLTLGGRTDTLHSLSSPRLASGSLPLPRKPNTLPATALPICTDQILSGLDEQGHTSTGCSGG